MSNEETSRNLSEIIEAAASDCAKLRGPVIFPWRMDANQDHAPRYLEDCGCGFAPDDEGRGRK
jgi:hypothetical protein